MKQIVTQKPGTLIYRDIADPIVKKDEVLIEVKSIGICNSDVAPYKGKILDIMPLPFVMGHEFGGIIKEINSKTDNFKIGDKVSVYPQLNCGSCYYCNNGMEHLCANQSMFGSPKLEGAMSEFIAVPVKNLVKMSDSFNIEYAGLIEPATVSLHAVGDVKDLNVVVIGTGAIGAMMCSILKQNNCKFIAMDIEDRALEIAKNLEADLAVNLKNTQRKKIIEDYLGEEKADVIVLAHIDKENMDFAMDLVRKHGLIILMATPPKSLEFDLYTPLFKELTLKWSICYSYKEFEKAARLIEKGVIDAKKIITNIFPFEKAKEAFEYKANNFALKVIIKN
ncbi:MAG: alcohol dehydrogenase catalytic domain-containing protein [Actinobacteria bacterium]|nr:alcohol dehydrogenase catalytic domain-containing protein [Actinomycetota bacterium]